PGFGIHQVPDRSGLPSGARGVGADRLGLPSAVFGMLVCLTFSHCPRAGVANSIPTSNQCVVFICSPLRSRELHEGCSVIRNSPRDRRIPIAARLSSWRVLLQTTASSTSPDLQP